MHASHKRIIEVMQTGVPLVDVINSPDYYLRPANGARIPVTEDVYYTMRELQYIEPDRTERNAKGKGIVHILRLTVKYRRSI